MEIDDLICKEDWDQIMVDHDLIDPLFDDIPDLSGGSSPLTTLEQMKYCSCGVMEEDPYLHICCSEENKENREQDTYKDILSIPVGSDSEDAKPWYLKEDILKLPGDHMKITTTTVPKMVTSKNSAKVNIIEVKDEDPIWKKLETRSLKGRKYVISPPNTSVGGFSIEEASKRSGICCRNLANGSLRSLSIGERLELGKHVECMKMKKESANCGYHVTQKESGLMVIEDKKLPCSMTLTPKSASGSCYCCSTDIPCKCQSKVALRIGTQGGYTSLVTKVQENGTLSSPKIKRVRYSEDWMKLKKCEEIDKDNFLDDNISFDFNNSFC
jgi:hypothetical protein